LSDGSPPLQRVVIERACQGAAPIQDALSGKKGEYFWRIPGEMTGVGRRGRVRLSVLCVCVLRARLKDMESKWH